MLRALVTGGFLAIAVAIIWASFMVGVDTSTGNLFVNLGTEIIGIVITVSVVEWFFERRRLQNRGRQLAGNALHAVEHAVWVWQGGPRQMETDEVRGILHAVDDDDPLADFTEGLLLNIGTRARRLLSNDPEAVSALPGFMNGLEHLARLSAIRDGKDRMPSRKVADILDEGTSDLAKALGKPTERHLASLIRYRDPSLASQERRHFGGGNQSSFNGFRPEPTEFQDD
ncbi:MAG: hypothetical protein R3253_02430 [Longimicrobiales bacterium]|nr:hypothetical protein [Longimicrobiales bacterium]